MCGIIGYIGTKDVIPILLQGLKRLEYRGYDSAGLSVIKDGRLKLVKREGRISELENAISELDLTSTLGIAHTRWATHGEPNEINAHPHTDTEKELAIVHNGIIENFQALKRLLQEDGFEIISDTDSEIIAHLVKKFYVDDLESAVLKALELVEGAFGLAVIHKQEEKIVVARRGSPLIVGVGEGEMFVASDVSAVLGYTRKVIYLNDNEMAVIKPDSYQVKNLDGEKVDKDVHEIRWTIDQIEKKGYKHFMKKEIFEQSDAIENTLRGRLKNGSIKLNLDLDVGSVRRIIITACGTSWHSALIGKFFFERFNHLPVEVDYASEFRYRDPLLSADDLVIVISQSGETADTLGAIREAKSKGARTFGIVNVVGSTIAREVDSGMYLHAGPEIGVASTKAFTTQVVDLLLLSLYFRQHKGDEIDEHIIYDLETLPQKISDILEQDERIKRLAESISHIKNMLYLGRGMNFPVALEGALKLKEISYIHAEGYPAAEMKHGPIALIDKDMPVLFVTSKDHTYDKVLSNMQEIKARGGMVIAIANEEDEKLETLADKVIIVPDSTEEISSILNVLPLQLLAYHVADIKGIDVDKPRNLAKSVTVE